MKKYTFGVILVALAAMLSSCHSVKHDLNIFENLPGQSGTITVPSTLPVIEPEMSLLITVSSSEPAATAEFNPPLLNPAYPGSTAITGTPVLKAYEVDRNGDIDFPRLGTIHVAGMTQQQLKDYLVRRLTKYVKDPIVSVNIQGYKVTVMGEVNNPATLNSTADRLSVLEAIAQCGGLSDYAKRDDVVVMRRLDDNTIAYQKLNLHDAKIMESPYYWLKNEDVVVIAANDVKQDNSKYNQHNGYKLSVISTIVSAVSVIASLVIALTIK